MYIDMTLHRLQNVAVTFAESVWSSQNLALTFATKILYDLESTSLIFVTKFSRDICFSLENVAVTLAESVKVIIYKILLLPVHSSSWTLTWICFNVIMWMAFT